MFNCEIIADSINPQNDRLTTMKINKYPDGTSYVSSDVELIGKIEHIVTFRINSYEDLWHLNQFVDAFWNFNKQKPTIIISNLIDAQADRRFNKDESSGLKLVCKFLNSLNANFKIFHPHNPEVVEALMDNVEIIDNSEFIRQVITNLDWYNIVENGNRKDINSILMSPDAGGYKSLMKLCDKINWKGETYSASKSRKYDSFSGKSVLTQILDKENFEGKDILIVDDICVYGGTFKGLSKLLKERNCGKLYLAVSHITVQNHTKDSVFNYFDKVFCTNSKYDNYFIPDKDGGISPNNLQIIKLF